MREIKFRAWDGKKLLHVHYLEWSFSKGGDWLSGKLSEADSNGEFWMTNALPRKTVLMQFTGLKDKNGKEIYEGDIVEDLESVSIRKTYVVVWYENHARWAAQELGTGKKFGLYAFPLKVVGNIYENDITNTP